MKRRILSFSAIIVSMILMLSCSSEGGKTAGLLSKIPKSADVVFVGNATTVIESLGGSIKDSEVQLPSYITNLLGSDGEEGLEELNSFLKDSGIDVDACGLFLTFANSDYPIGVFSMSDQKKFISAIEDKGFSKDDKEGKVTIYSSDDYCIAIDNDYGYFCDNRSRAIEGLKDALKDLKDGSYADSPMGSYINKGNAMGLAVRIPKGDHFSEFDNLPIPVGGVCMYGDLDGDVLSVTAKVVDRDGKDIKDDVFSKYLDTSARINSDALAFLGKDECLAFATSIKDFKWDDFFDMIERNGNLSRSDRANLSVAQNFLEMIDGTIAVGLGVTDGLSSFSKLASGRDILSELSLTIVVETKDGKAKALLDQIMGFMEEANVPFSETSDGFKISDESIGTLYGKNSGDMLVFSTHPISEDSDSEVVKQVKFSDHLGCVALVLDRNNKLMQDLSLSNDVKATAFSDGKMEGKFTLEVSGGNGEGGILAKIVQMGLALYQNSESILSAFQQSRGGYDYGYYDDSMYDEYEYDEEEAVVEEVSECEDEW